LEKLAVKLGKRRNEDVVTNHRFVDIVIIVGKAIARLGVERSRVDVR
jgi:hypothetical protein